MQCSWWVGDSTRCPNEATTTLEFYNVASRGFAEYVWSRSDVCDRCARRESSPEQRRVLSKTGADVRLIPLTATPLHHEELRNPMGETVLECAQRFMREERSFLGQFDSTAQVRPLARDRAMRIALSPMARRDGTAEFYAAVAAHLSDA